jgi:cytochrome o ubiquinol oxidase subunit 1
MLFGKLTLEAIPYHEPILIATFAGVALGGLVVLALMTYYKKWGWLWREWLTSVDHKKIGVMYIFVALVMLLRGFSDAIMMRAQQALAHDGAAGVLPPHHYDQIFTAHGVIMIFFMAMPFITGLMNLVVPLQIGARDVAFPFLNSLSFWLFVAGVVLIMLSLFVGEFAQTGWLAFPPLSGLQYSPGVGVDYYIWALQISGLGTTLTGINFLVTILKMRAPGMKMMHMPIFTWTALITNILMIAAFPFLTVSLALLTADRYLGTHFFTNDGGGNAMMYINLIWIWGHPEVYILILPCFGVFSEVVSTFSRKPLFGYTSMVWATSCIGLLSFIVWLHHFFTMGSGANVNAFFGITTMIIAVPTGVKIFNWLFTMFRGRLQMTSMMYWTVGFMVTFTIGGMTGVMMAIPAVSFVLHNSLFLIAHFHNVIIGGVVFGMFAGINYWWPKAFGFTLDRKWGVVSFWAWNIGFWVAFGPLYVLGLMGITRRLRHFDDPSLQPWFIVVAIGALIIAVGIAAFLMQIYVSIKNRDALADTTGDPWNGRTLEWATSSPPPAYNFAFTPVIHDLDAWYDMKNRKAARPTEGFRAIHMPKSTGTGVILAGLSMVFALAMVWYIWWLAAASFAGVVIASIWHTFNYDRDFDIPEEDVRRNEDMRTEALARLGV